MSTENLAEQLAHAARDLNSDDVQQTLEQAVALAVHLIAGCDGAGVTLARRGQAPETPACTAESVARGDALQHELQEGPCVDALWDEEIVISADLANEERWTTWGPRVVAELGIRSMMCIQLFVEDEILGVLSMYSTQQSEAFTRPVDRYVGQNLATHISLALFAAQQIENLNSGLVWRNVIGQAEGILMERFDIDAKEASERLKRVSSELGADVVTVAEEIILTRRLPTGSTHATAAECAVKPSSTRQE